CDSNRPLIVLDAISAPLHNLAVAGELVLYFLNLCGSFCKALGNSRQWDIRLAPVAIETGCNEVIHVVLAAFANGNDMVCLQYNVRWMSAAVLANKPVPFKDLE